jgi:NADPH2:quinone reductase
MRAIRITTQGGPEVLQPTDLPDPTPDDNGLVVRSSIVGVNFADTMLRSGVYPAPLPFIPGGDGVGVVRAVGAAVKGFEVGQRVAWSGMFGSYSELVKVAAATAAVMPDDLSDEQGLILSQGLTAHYLAHDVFQARPGTTALVHSAAGGVGLLLCQILKLRGTRVIGVVSSQDKVAAAKGAGAAEVIVSPGPDVAPRVRELTGGEGVDVVFDAVGAPTFDAGVASLRRRGLFVLYGASGGALNSINPRPPGSPGSISFIRPGLADFIATRAEFEGRVTDLFAWLRDGRLKLEIGGRFPLDQAAEAHRAIESRATTGKLVLVTA